jgi:hypothetical protein
MDLPKWLTEKSADGVSKFGEFMKGNFFGAAPLTANMGMIAGGGGQYNTNVYVDVNGVNPNNAVETANAVGYKTAESVEGLYKAYNNNN